MFLAVHHILQQTKTTAPWTPASDGKSCAACAVAVPPPCEPSAHATPIACSMMPFCACMRFSAWSKMME
jgi:hypothetical protein